MSLNQEKPQGFEKSNDFSGDDKFFSEYLIARQERLGFVWNLGFDWRKFVVARRGGDIEFEKGKMPQVFEKTNDFSMRDDKFFSEYLIA